jgi:hypothetical protein
MGKLVAQEGEKTWREREQGQEAPWEEKKEKKNIYIYIGRPSVYTYLSYLGIPHSKPCVGTHAAEQKGFREAFESMDPPL